MLLIPAIDLKDGKCVRLRQGKMEDETVFSDDPVAMAGKWVEAGARRLHIVDLNGAFEGKPMNAGVVHDICEAYPDLQYRLVVVSEIMILLKTSSKQVLMNSYYLL